MALCRIGDQVFRYIDTLACDSAQLFGFSLVVLTEIMNLMYKLLKSRPIRLLGLRIVVGKYQNLILES